MASKRNLNANECVECLLKLLSGRFIGDSDLNRLSKADWVFILKLISWHRIARVTMNSIINSKTQVPDYFFSNLQQRSKSCAMNNLAQVSQLPIIQKAFSESKVEFLLLKGVVLSMQLYQNVVDRHSKDIDIWVSEDQVQTAISVLKSIGFYLVKPSIDLNDREFKKYLVNQKDMVFRSSHTVAVEIELHWRLDKNKYCFPLKFKDAYQRHERIAINDKLYPTLSSVDNYFYLSAHGTNALYGRLKWLLDWQRLCQVINIESDLSCQNMINQSLAKMPAQVRQMSLSHSLVKKVNHRRLTTKNFNYLKDSKCVQMIEQSVFNGWAHLSYMGLIRRWIMRFLLVTDSKYKLEHLRLAFVLLYSKIFMKKGVYE